MLSQNDLLPEIKRRKTLNVGGVVIEYCLNIMNQGNTGVTIVKITINDELLLPEATCLDPGAEIDCLICRTGSVQQREGRLPPYKGKVIWSNYSGNQQIVSTFNFRSSTEGERPDGST